MRRIIASLLLFSMLANILPVGTSADEATPFPAAPLLLEPADKAVVATNPIFVWTIPGTPASSRIEFSSDPDFADLLLGEVMTATTYAPETPFTAGATLYWRVWSLPDGVEPVVSETRLFIIELSPTVTAEPAETWTATPEPTVPESTATRAMPTETITTPHPTITQTARASNVPTGIPTLAPESSPVARSEITGSYASEGYHLTGVGRSTGSVHPNVLVDDNLGTIWTSPANHPASAYFVLSLDSVQPIGEICWVLGKTGRADEIRIAVSRDRATWTEVGRARNSAVGEWQSVSLDRSVRYIRFLLVNTRGDRWLGGLVEVEALPPAPKPEPTATRSPATPTPIADGIVRNASFEAGSSGWYLESGVRVSATAYRGGSRSLAMTRSGGFADQRIALQPGKSYALSAWGYLTRPFDVGLIGIVYRDSSGNRLRDLEPATLEFTATRFVSGVREFRVPAGVASANVFIWKQEGGSGFFVDDIRIKSLQDAIEDPAAGNDVDCQQLMVPGYFDPRTTSLWQTTIGSGTGVGLVILNPNSGVGDEYDSIWAEVVKSSRTAGFTVVAYVQTDYGTRSTESVITEMDKYRAWYGVKDFFLDEAATSFMVVERYRAMANNVHKGDGIAVLNFGWVPHPAYMEFTDVAGVFEDSYAVYSNDYARPTWFHNYPANRFLHIVHSTPASKWTTVIKQSRTRNAGYVWVTDDNTVSYYKSLPSFWTRLNITVAATC